MITQDEKQLVLSALRMAQEKGAQKARISYTKSEEDLIATLNSQIDRITHCSDRSMSFALFVDGSFSSFSTNKLDPLSLSDFISKAIDITRTIAPDPYRKLPDPSRYCTSATTGDELQISDPYREQLSAEKRCQIASEASIFDSEQTEGREWKLISEEAEYSDSSTSTIVVDSNGLCCLHNECSFDYGTEVTIEHKGERYSSYWWDSASRFSELKPRECNRIALERAVSQIGAQSIESGKYNMVISSEIASKVVSPILRALNAYELQQHNSFLPDSLGKKLFPDGLSIVDLPHIAGNCCSKLFDSEGIATKEGPIIEGGVVKTWFVNTYMSAKMGITPTIEAAVRPALLPWPRKGLDEQALREMCGDGIYVTSFNGGNSNPVTGDFSYGVEGFLFKDGKIVKPVSEMLVTGNFLELWSGLIAAGDDARACLSKLIPTLAFCNVDFSGI